MQASLRSATIEDSDRVVEIYLSSRKQFLSYAPLVYSDSEIRSWIKDILIPSENVTVVVVYGEVAGFLAISRTDSYGWIDQLYLDPARVGQGLGDLLMKRAKEILAGPIRLYTFQKNFEARRFYSRHGFREIEFSDGSSNEEKTPDILMQWP